MHYLFFFNDTATTEIYTLSLHDALPILPPASTSQSSPNSTRISPEAFASANAAAGNAAASLIVSKRRASGENTTNPGTCDASTYIFPSAPSRICFSPGPIGANSRRFATRSASICARALPAALKNRHITARIFKAGYAPNFYAQALVRLVRLPNNPFGCFSLPRLCPEEYRGFRHRRFDMV